MRVTLTHPFVWPYVRRGSERFIAELARYMKSAGHEVTTVATSPDKAAVEETEEFGRRILLKHRWANWWSRFKLINTDAYVFQCSRALSRIESDVVHTLHHSDAIGAFMARSKKKYKLLVQAQGPPIPEIYRRLPPELSMIRKVFAKADRVAVLSEYCRTLMRNNFGVEPVIIPMSVDMSVFTPKVGSKEGPPTILSTASFKEPRKGARTLVKAFVKLKERVPDAILQLSGEITPDVQAELARLIPPAILPSVQMLGVGALGDLPKLYREATIVCLPSMHEAFGMVLLEAWSSGTPVVVTRHGAFPELLEGHPRIGAMFDPQSDGQESKNIDGLVDALVEGLELARDPAVPALCRARADEFGWHHVGPHVESIYRDMLGESPTA